MKNGFTLVELIIYIGIIAVVLIGAFDFAWQIIYGDIKSQTIREVQQNARFAMEKISKIITKSAGINNPPPGESANFLSLKMVNPNLNPTIFDISNNKLRITQGQGASYDLTSDRVVVRDFQVTNLSYPASPGTLQINLTLEHINPVGRNEYEFSLEVKSTTSLVPGGAGSSYTYVLQSHYRWRNDDGGE